MKILIAIYTKSHSELLTAHCIKWGFTVISAKNGKEAVEAFLSESPDMVIMEGTMPVMEGYEAAAKIKNLSSNRWIPIIIVIHSNREEEVRSLLESGADDFLTIPVNISILDQKIRMIQRFFEMQIILNESLRKIEQYHNKIEEEMHLAKRIMDNFIRLGEIDKELVQYWIMPTSDFSGDVIAAARTYSNNLYVILADAAGHGLPAALTVLPIMQIFYPMTEKGCPIEGIAEELNWRIHTQMPTGCHIAAILACIDERNRTIKIWNGGNPPPIFINQQGQILHRWESKHLPLGILNKEEFNAETEIFRWEEAGQLVICSDGLLEAVDEQGKVFGIEQMLQIIKSVKLENRFSILVKAVQRHLAGRLGHDDISLIMINLHSTDFSSRVRTDLEVKAGKSKGFHQWKLSFCLGPEKLKSLNILHLFLDWLNLMNIRRLVSGPIFVILSELYNNALDHGLLELDSRLKSLPGGFDEYLRQREERLASLHEGYIIIEMEQVEIDERKALRISVIDSGKGFNYAALNNEMPADIRHSTNGIPLVKSLCSEIRYLGKGNEVIVDYPL